MPVHSSAQVCQIPQGMSQWACSLYKPGLKRAAISIHLEKTWAVGNAFEQMTQYTTSAAHCCITPNKINNSNTSIIFMQSNANPDKIYV